MIRPSARRHLFLAQGEGSHLNGHATASLNHRRFSDRFSDRFGDGSATNHATTSSVHMRLAAYLTVPLPRSADVKGDLVARVLVAYIYIS